MPVYADNGEIRGAGGVVLSVADATIRILLVHRPAFHDWSIPKGNVERGEQDAEAALREVMEETGLHCTLLAPIGEMHYRNRKGRPKCARYWAMLPRGGVFRPTTEVDECAWLDLDAAASRVTRSGDREFLARLAQYIRCEPNGVESTLMVDGYLVVHE